MIKYDSGKSQGEGSYTLINNVTGIFFCGVFYLELIIFNLILD